MGQRVDMGLQTIEVGVGNGNVSMRMCNLFI